MDIRQGILFEGRPGLSMLHDAISIAEKELGTKKISLHPDYLFVTAPDGKKQLGVEQAEAILSRGSLRPAIAKRQVIVIDGIDRMTVPAQNKLLKLVEEQEHILVLAVAYSSAVLDTIRSRLTVRRYEPLPYEKFREATDGLEQREQVMFFHLTDGCPGLIPEMGQLVPVCRDIMEAVESGNLPALLPAMHLLTEKDKLSVAQGAYRLQILQFLEACFASELSFLYGSPDGFLNGVKIYTVSQLTKILKILADDKVICNRPTYSKDDFFQLMARVITA